MLDGGCDPVYLARRLLTRMAVEDIGLADPRALQMAIDAWDTFERLGSPEGELALAQLTLLSGQPRPSRMRPTWPTRRRAPMSTQFGTQRCHCICAMRRPETDEVARLCARTTSTTTMTEGGVALDQTGFPDALGRARLLRAGAARHGS
jgi:putative ATPase